VICCVVYRLLPHGVAGVTSVLSLVNCSNHGHVGTAPPSLIDAPGCQLAFPLPLSLFPPFSLGFLSGSCYGN
jgi:hypothetical protein